MSQPPAAGPRHGAALITLLEKAQVDRSSAIAVTGSSGLSALLWLCRHGYDQVGYLKSGYAQERPTPCWSPTPAISRPWTGC